MLSLPPVLLVLFLRCLAAIIQDQAEKMQADMQILRRRAIKLHKRAAFRAIHAESGLYTGAHIHGVSESELSAASSISLQAALNIVHNFT